MIPAHVNPGTDTTINPVVIDDSKRERKIQTEKCGHECVCLTYHYGNDKGKPCNIKKDCSNDTRTSAPSQQRIDAAITELDRLQIESFEWLEINAYQKAIALLQAGRK